MSKKGGNLHVITANGCSMNPLKMTFSSVSSTMSWYYIWSLDEHSYFQIIFMTHFWHIKKAKLFPESRAQQPSLLFLVLWAIIVVTKTKRLVQPNCSAELLPCGSATELFSVKHRTFFICFVLLDDPHWSLVEIAKKLPTEPKLKQKNHYSIAGFAMDYWSTGIFLLVQDKFGFIYYQNVEAHKNAHS